jgi:ubiquinone/menaquinone biosynthesis C-methylase UbiE
MRASRLVRWAVGILGRRATDASYVRYLQDVAADPTIQRLRSEAVLELRLAPGHHVVDLGCGPGTMTVQLASCVGDSGRVVGVDRDRQMVRTADVLAVRMGVSGHLTHQVDDCTALSLGNDTFDACYCERVFQHLADRGPALAAAEALRILKPGGRVVIVDSDWSTLVINAGPQVLERRCVTQCLMRFPNPAAGRHLRDLVMAAGAAEVHCRSSTLSISATGATAALLNRAAEESLSADELMVWRQRLDDARQAERPYGHLIMTLVAGTKPRAS